MYVCIVEWIDVIFPVESRHNLLVDLILNEGVEWSYSNVAL